MKRIQKSILLAICIVLAVGGQSVFAGTGETVGALTYKATLPSDGYMYLGMYPQTEIVDTASKSGCYSKNWESSGDYIVDSELYAMLESAKWNDDNEATIEGVKYKRITVDDAVQSFENVPDHYEWHNGQSTYRYFKCEPIKWRILETTDDSLFLLSDIIIDGRAYSTYYNDGWENSDIRYWLNGLEQYAGSGFVDVAFNDQEKSAIIETTVNNSISYTHSYVKETVEKVYLLSCDEVASESFGFESPSAYDHARMLRSTSYAKAKGIEIDNGYMLSGLCVGNTRWWLRNKSTGGACCVEADGYVYYKQRTSTDCVGVVPALNIAVEKHVDISDFVIDDTEFVYDGTEKKPTVTVEGLVEGKDYTVDYTNNINAGTASITVTGKGNWEGEITKSFVIKPADISSKTIVLSETEFVYDGTEKKPTVTVEGLVEGEDYTVEYADNVSIGTASVTVTGKGNWKGKIEKNFSIIEIEEEKPTIFDDDNNIRIYGSNRYETSIKLANVLKQSIEVNEFDNIVVACGSNYPDALAGGYLASNRNAPLITVDKTLSSEANVKEYIVDNMKSGGTVYILGGTGVVSTRFEKSLTDSGIVVKRLAGSNRFATNLAILEEAGTKDELLVCNAYGYADSLSASAVDLPIMLVGDTLTKEQVAFLESKNLKSYHLIGGEGAIKPSIEKSLNSKYPTATIERIAGKTRFETSVKVADAFFDTPEVVVFAYGLNFPDGLSGGPLAKAWNAPLILTTTDNSAAAKAYIAKVGASKSVTIGGPKLISDLAVKTMMGVA